MRALFGLSTRTDLCSAVVRPSHLSQSVAAKVRLLSPRSLGAPNLPCSCPPQIFRTANAPRTAPDATETLVAQALLDLENNVPDLKAELRPLQISAAREVDVKGGKKAIVVFVPVPQLKAFHKIQGRLTREVRPPFVRNPVRRAD